MQNPSDHPAITQILHDLSDPSAYPHPVDNVCAIQTHISCVFLTGETVYKVKKPVNFGFLDYTHREQRRLCCEKEVTLNRRLCPDLYEAVVPITLCDGRCRVDGEGEIIDWAVKMRRMCDSDMLRGRLSAGTITRHDMAAIADRLAQFHRTANTDDAIAQYGLPEIIKATVETTLETMERAAAEHVPETILRSLRAFIEALYVDEAPLYARMAAGRIRDCHGDLRIQNIALDPRYSDGIQIFDCIEFNDTLRFIDTAADIAYLAVDLELAGESAHRTLLMQRYREALEDAGIDTVLNRYRCYRAVVRGNIALLAAQEAEVPAEERSEQHEIAMAAYDLAFGITLGGGPPLLLITVGLSGSGKSWLAREAVPRLPAILISTDQIRREMSASAERDSRYALENRAATYREARRMAGLALQSRENVLIDATFLNELERTAVADLARDNGAELVVIECRCSDAVIRSRLERRRSEVSLSEADIAVYEEQRRNYRPIEPEEAAAFDHFQSINTEMPAIENARKLLLNLAKRRNGA